jgi:hypothetical protein
MADEPQKTAPSTTRSRSRRLSIEEDYDPDWGPTDEDVDDWAERERRRREAWLKGPTDEEKRAWAASRRRQAGDVEVGLTLSGPTDEEVEEWAERERKRREAWVQGPSEQERRAWARSARRRRPRAAAYSAPRRSAAYEDEMLAPPPEDTLRRLRRESELASKGLWHWASSAPYWYWAKLVDSGAEWEEGYEASERPRRIRLYADY